MAKVFSKNTKPEIKVRKYLFSKGFRYRLHDKKLPGSPDIILPKYKVIIFIHGCFWHNHSCKAADLPTSNLSYWQNKIYKNQLRDEKNQYTLKQMKWDIIIVWECELKNKILFKERMDLLIDEIKRTSKI